MPLGARAVHFLRTLPDHRLLDRLIRGRAWIPLLGVMLVGIVAMQVEVLKLGASIGRSIQRTSTLQTNNEMLREAVASLDGDARIETMAAKQGMVMPAPGGVGFLSAAEAPAALARAIANIHAPDSAGFLALSSTNGTITTSSNSSTTGTAALATTSATLASTLAQSASQSSGASSPASSQTTGTSTSTPATTPTQASSAATSGSPAPTTGGTTGSSTGAAGGSSPSGSSGQGSSGTATPAATPTHSTSSGAAGSGGATIGG